MAQIIELEARPQTLSNSKNKIESNNLKSFQRISEEDMRYLRQLERCRKDRQNEDYYRHLESISLNHHWRALTISMRKMLRRIKNKILYETVPADDICNQAIDRI